MPGYQPDFLGTSAIVTLPDYAPYKNHIARNSQSGKDALDYIYYSVVLHGTRRIPLFSASNIFRKKLLNEDRIGDFKTDKRVLGNQQLSNNDYKIFNSIRKAAIDKGHMTKREDVQWDTDGNAAKATDAAKSTFFYPNAAPQHEHLNSIVWKRLEDSIMQDNRVLEPGKVCVFTGPVIDEKDPLFIKPLADGSSFQVPKIFWKVVYYVKPDNKLYRAGFLMGHELLLKKEGLLAAAKPQKGFTALKEEASLKPFLDFEDSATFQVSVKLIQKITQLKFAKGKDLYGMNDTKNLDSIQLPVGPSFIAGPIHTAASLPVSGIDL
jgi:endonuclease G, mitochondrial